MNYKIIYYTLSQIRKLSTSVHFNSQKNHYTSLGLGKTATQADIKAAYYELSKVYHPDKNQGHTLDLREQHSQKFRDITEAYEVLGNVRTRKLYDKGFMGVTSHPSENRKTSPNDPLYNFYKSRETRTRPPPPDGRQPIYDFDEWSRQHYGETLRKIREVKERRAFYAEQRQSKKEYMQHEICIYGGFVFLFMCMCFKEIHDSDVVRTTLGSKKKNSVDN